MKSEKCENGAKEQESLPKSRKNTFGALSPTFLERVHIWVIKLVALGKPLIIGQHFTGTVSIKTKGGYIADSTFEAE